nr:ABC transporter permease subunit [Paraburkholderia atlantica]
MNPGFGEAGSVLGASIWRRFWHVTLPLISPGVFAGALFSVLISLDNLGVSYFFGSANTTTLPVVMLSYLQNQFDPSIAAISTCRC